MKAPTVDGLSDTGACGEINSTKTFGSKVYRCKLMREELIFLLFFVNNILVYLS